MWCYPWSCIPFQLMEKIRITSNTPRKHINWVTHWMKTVGDNRFRLNSVGLLAGCNRRQLLPIVNIFNLRGLEYNTCFIILVCFIYLFCLFTCFRDMWILWWSLLSVWNEIREFRDLYVCVIPDWTSHLID